MLRDDDGNELEQYRTDIYDRKVLFNYLKEAEKLMGSIMYEVVSFRNKGFEEAAAGADIEGLTAEQVNALDHLERCINHLAFERPKGFDRW